MKKFSNSICIGVISNIVFAIISFVVKEHFNQEIQIPLWICFIIAAGIIIVFRVVNYGIKQYRIRKALSSYTYGAFGHSCSYKWEYVKNPNGIYGYEPVNIQIAESQTSIDTPNHKVFRFTHFVDEQKIKLIIRLTLMYMVEKKSQKEIYPILEYLHWTEKK